MVVKNKIAKVLVLKALGHPVLRFLPGLNKLPESVKDLQPYLDGNLAAQAMLKDDLEIISGKLTTEQTAEAEAAKAKNDRLNKSSFLLKNTQEKLMKAEQAGKVDGKVISELRAEMKELKRINKEAMDLINELSGPSKKEVAAIEKARKAVVKAETDFEKAAVGEAKGTAADVLQKAKDELGTLSPEALTEYEESQK